MPVEKQDRRLDLAAKAGWYYYINGDTQDAIARKLQVSRQAAQRLVALAVSEKLIKFRLDHPIAECVALTEALRDRFRLDYADVTPDDGPEVRDGLGVAAAAYLEQLLASQSPIVLGFGTGRTLRAAVEELTPINRPQHRILSLVGNMTGDGRASPFDVAVRLADRTGAQCYPMPTPVVAGNIAEKELLLTQRSVETVRNLAAQAKAFVVGIGQVCWNAPIQADGFLDEAEVGELLDAGAVGELISWPFDADGAWIESGIVDRLMGTRPQAPPTSPTIAVAGGPDKTQAIRAALRGGLLTGLITDKATAETLLEGA